MSNYALALPALYYFIILALATYLLIRGITHAFVCFFAAAALIELIRSMAFLFMSLAPGGFSAHARYLPLTSAIGFFGMLIFIAGFVSLTTYLLRMQPPQA